MAAESGTLAWVGLVGLGSVKRDFGHAVAVDGSGGVLAAGRFDRPEGDPVGELVRLDPAGEPRWRVRLDGDPPRAPLVALDDDGAAYIAGPFEPTRDGTLGRALHSGLTKLDVAGRPVWHVRMGEEGAAHTGPLHVAADPRGGACVAWIEAGVLRLVRLDASGVPLWAVPSRFCGAFNPCLRLGVDGSGAVVLSGVCAGVLRVGEAAPIMASGGARFLARIQLDGRVCWAQVLGDLRIDHSALTTHRDGGVSFAGVVAPAELERRELGERDVMIVTLDPRGRALRGTRFAMAPHSAVSLSLATSGEALALAGYLSGGLTIGAKEVRSTTPGVESVYVARLGKGGDAQAWARAIDTPQMQAGLSVHGDRSGAITIAGWCADGSMDFGTGAIVARDRAALFVARMHS